MHLSMSAPLVAAAVSTIGVIGGAYLYKKYNKNKLPEKWVDIGHVKQLYAYPIKSCGPVILTQVECTSMGMKDAWLRDRNFMIIDEEENMPLSIKSHPEVVNIKPTIKKAIMTLQHPKMESPLEINIAEVIVMKKILHAHVETSPVTVYDCGEEAYTWINACLDSKENTFRLVYYPSEKTRPMFKNGQKMFKKLRTDDIGALADICTYHVINESSVSDLNSRVPALEITDLRFRPNIVVSGCKAFDEDNWKYVKIGENIFEVIFPAFRCLFITLDPLTGKRNMEPMAALKSYRIASDPEVRKVTSSAPLMGIYMALRSGPGTLSVTEPFSVAY